jgi:hypothetical protein
VPDAVAAELPEAEAQRGAVVDAVAVALVVAGPVAVAGAEGDPVPDAGAVEVPEAEAQPDAVVDAMAVALVVAELVAVADA